MKKINFLLATLLLLTTFMYVSCDVEPIDPAVNSSQNNINSNDTGTGNSSGDNNSGSGSGTGSGSGYAMTAKINGISFQANNPFGNNMFSGTNIWSYFPLADFVMLQGRQGGLLGNPEINIWLKRDDIAVGTYNFVFNNSTTPSHYIDLIDNSTLEYEDTVNGSITITEVNTTTHVVKGTFTFTCSASPNVPNPVINVTVTEGTFNYIYMN